MTVGGTIYKLKFPSKSQSCGSGVLNRNADRFIQSNLLWIGSTHPIAIDDFSELGMDVVFFDCSSLDRDDQVARLGQRCFA